MSKAGKKKVKKGKKGKKKEGDGLELSLEERFKKTTQEVDSLKQHLAERQEYARTSKASEQAIRERLQVAKETITDERVQTKDLTFDLTRQYKTLQLHSETRIQALEAAVKRLTTELTSTKQELAIVIKERDLLREEKELEVSALNTQIEFIQKSYESIIKEALDGLTTQLEVSRTQWNDESQNIDERTEELLQNFGTPIIHNKPL